MTATATPPWSATIPWRRPVTWACPVIVMTPIRPSIPAPRSCATAPKTKTATATWMRAVRPGTRTVTATVTVMPLSPPGPSFSRPDMSPTRPTATIPMPPSIPAPSRSAPTARITIVTAAWMRAVRPGTRTVTVMVTAMPAYRSRPSPSRPDMSPTAPTATIPMPPSTPVPRKSAPTVWITTVTVTWMRGVSNHGTGTRIVTASATRPWSSTAVPSRSATCLSPVTVTIPMPPSIRMHRKSAATAWTTTVPAVWTKAV